MVALKSIFHANYIFQLLLRLSSHKINQNQMGFWSNIKGAIYKVDFFYTGELLRFREEPEYHTLMGGVLSIIIIVLLFVTFYSKLIGTFAKVNIQSSISTISLDTPAPYTISTMPGEPFMFGVQIWHHDLNSNPRYFDVNLVHGHLDTGHHTNSSLNVPLEPCTRDHWSEYPSILEGYNRLNMSYWLCMPKNLQYEISGKYSSVLSKTLEISISKCTNSSNFATPCATDSQISQLFSTETNFFYTIYFINPIINADSKQFLSYYLEDSNYIMFSAQDGQECQLMVEDYRIETDESLFPITEEEVDTGGIIRQNRIKNRYTIDPTNTAPLYATFFFYKSPLSLEVERRFQKIDQVLSYIGGLFGILVIFFFFVNVYNSYSFEIIMGGYLFKPDDDQMGKQLKKYQFFHFLLHVFYIILDFFGCSCESYPPTKLYHQCREEMVKQLDVLYLIKRVTFLERAINSLTTDKQRRALHLLEKRTLDEAKKDRRGFKWNDETFLFKHSQKNEKSDKDGLRDSAGPLQSEFDPSIKSNHMISDRIPPSPKKQYLMSSSNLKMEKSKKFKIKQQNEPSSDEESDGQDSTHILKDLIDLRGQSKNSSTSKWIWNHLSQDVKEEVFKNLHQNDGISMIKKNSGYEGMKIDDFDADLANIQENQMENSDIMKEEPIEKELEKKNSHSRRYNQLPPLSQSSNREEKPDKVPIQSDDIYIEVEESSPQKSDKQRERREKKERRPKK